VRIVGIIPSRYGARRLPGKPLLKLNGLPVIEHVWRQASKARSLSRLIIATDDKRIYKVIKNIGGDVVMTPGNCASGTDRLAWVAKKLNYEIVVNVQGDEPFLPGAYIDKLVEPLLDDKKIQISTLAAPLSAREARNPNIVKVVCDETGNALYFSRACIPYVRDNRRTFHRGFLQHLGVYAYRRSFLVRFSQMEQTPLEKAEQLEQLRALEHGVKIRVIRVAKPTLSIDTPEDLRRARKIMKR
jgi:3-deoxy-manno-octulosonate cytidylyltransferase (CMP-KDO synthetase)